MQHLRTVDVFIDHRHRFSLGTEAEGSRRVLSVEIAAGSVDYDIFDVLGEDEYQALLDDPDAATVRAEELRAAHEHERFHEFIGQLRARHEREAALGVDEDD